MEKEVTWVATKAEDAEKFKQCELDVELPEYTVNLELLLNTRNCIVLYESMSLTMVKIHQHIK